MEMSHVVAHGITRAVYNQFWILANCHLPVFFAKQDRQSLVAEVEKLVNTPSAVARHGFLEHVRLILRDDQPTHSKAVVVIQIPPHRRTLWFGNAFFEAEAKRSKTVKPSGYPMAVSLPMPHLLIAVSYGGAKRYELQANDFNLGFMTKPLVSLDQPVFKPHLPNNVGGLTVCMGNTRVYKSCLKGLLPNAQENVSRFFRSSFTTHNFSFYENGLREVGLADIVEWSSCAEYPLRSLAKSSIERFSISDFLFQLLRTKNTDSGSRRQVVLNAADLGFDSFEEESLFAYTKGLSELLDSLCENGSAIRTRYEKAKGNETARRALVRSLAHKIANTYNRE